MSLGKNFNDSSKVIKNIKKSDAYLEIKKMIKKIPRNYKNNFIEIYCELFFLETFRKAFGEIPENMNIEKSKLCISKKIFEKILNLIYNI